MSSSHSSAASTDAQLGAQQQKPPFAEESALWERMRGGDENAKQMLLQHYLPLARTHAAILYGNRHLAELEFDDFHHYAIVGLLEAMERFDPENGAGFATYAAHRIKGAILNGIEKLAEKQQQIQARKRILAERAETLRENASHPAKGVEDLLAKLADIAIDLAIGYMLEGSRLYQTDSEETQPDTTYTRHELKQLTAKLNHLVDRLPERERLIVKLHYMHGAKFDAIAKELELTKGRISQLHQGALAQLRNLYETENSINKTF